MSQNISVRDVWGDSHLIHHSWWPLVEFDLSKSQFNMWHHAVPLNYFWVINDRFYILELWPEVWWSHCNIFGLCLSTKYTVSREPKRRQCFQASLSESSWKPEKVQRIKLSFGKTFKMKNIHVVSPSILNCLCKLGYWQVMHNVHTHKNVSVVMRVLIFVVQFSSVVNFLCWYASL